MGIKARDQGSRVLAILFQQGVQLIGLVPGQA